MQAWLLEMDRSLLVWINQGWSSPWLDPVFIFFTEKRNFIVPAALGVGWILWKEGRPGRTLLLALLLGVLFCDQVSSFVVKRCVHRIRPCHVMADLKTPYGQSGSYSFPSSHAANMAGLATVMLLSRPAWGWYFAVFAFLVGLSRVYLGVHYPSDVLGGFLLGGALGWLAWRCAILITRRWRPEKAESGGPS